LYYYYHPIGIIRFLGQTDLKKTKTFLLGPLPSLLFPSTEAPDFSSSSTASEWPLPAA